MSETSNGGFLSPLPMSQTSGRTGRLVKASKTSDKHGLVEVTGSADYAIKDSGARKEFEHGMVRDTAEEKTDWTLVADGPMLRRWAEHLTAGAKKYEKRNWLKGRGDRAALERYLESAFRHFMDWYYGLRDEDHAAAVFFNINGYEDWLKESETG